MGYLLGRRKKLRTAMAVGAAIAAGRLSRDPMSLLQRGGELLGNSSVLGQVSGLSKPLAAAGKAAAAGVVSRQIDSMGDRIKRRTDALRVDGDQAEPDDEEQTESGADERAEQGGNGRAKGRPARQSRAADPDADDEYDEDDFDEEGDEDEDEPEEERRPPARRRAPQAKTDDGEGSPARRSGRGAPVRRRVSNR